MRAATYLALTSSIFVTAGHARPWDNSDASFGPSTVDNTLTIFGTDGSPVTTKAFTFTATTVPSFNRGPLPTFAPPASCSQLTARILKAENQYSPDNAPDDSSFSYTTYADTYTQDDSATTATVLGQIYSLTDIYGPGYAWFLNYQGQFIAQNALATTPLTIPPMPCFPTNYFDPADGQSWESVSAYYSPATACPTGWAIANTTTTTRTTDKASTITETAALCCPSGWVGDDSFFGCQSANEDSVYTADAVFGNVLGRLKPTNLTVTDSPDNAIYPATELNIEIRWQSSDLRKAGSSKNGGVASHGGPLSPWIAISSICTALFVTGAAFIL